MSSRNLSNEITTLKAALKSLLDDLSAAEIYLNNDRTQWAEDDLEDVYFQLFKLAEQSDKLKALIAEGERKAKEKLKAKGGLYV